MTKKHFRRLALILGVNNIDPGSQLVKDLMAFLLESNPHFDRDRFLTAIRKVEA